MGMAVWILICLFSSVGLVQCGFWLVESFRGNKGSRRGYHVIPLYDRADELEDQIRFGMSCLRGVGADSEHVLLADMGLGAECRQICEKLIHGCGGFYVCEARNLEDTIRRLDDLQSGANIVE